ncbi:hypothetical protein [Streptomyces sp. rh34]|uniref:hypothetical protein n=1 Tax=Streptomyces sp. rh34 TaxID=2034272 RepID=UPI0015CF191F|nr:hypothetical protein [Streptomyces sp. rh34]
MDPEVGSTLLGGCALQEFTNCGEVGLLFPQVDADAAPDIVDGGRTLADADFMSGKTEDRYPGVFELAQVVDGGGRASARAEAAPRLAALPHRVVRLSHDVSASAAVVGKVTASI